jgi:delta-lactam-biosynthetic de-N-acetylase
MLNKMFLYVGICLTVVLAVVLCINEYNEESVMTNSGIINILDLSNKKISWGIKREKNNVQPAVGITNKILIDKYQGICLGNKDKKIIYLTFDEGYEAGYTSKILDVLKENNVKATFFITGAYLNNETELVKRMIDEGHIVGNHTVNHPSMPEVENEETLKKEIMDLHIAVYEKLGYEMRFIRPPKGEYSERTLAISKQLGYTTVMWSFAYDDWDVNKQKGDVYAKDKIISNIHNGSVILLHAVSKDNCNVLDYCIKELKNQGYEFGDLNLFNR